MVVIYPHAAVIGCDVQPSSWQQASTITPATVSLAAIGTQAGGCVIDIDVSVLQYSGSLPILTLTS